MYRLYAANVPVERSELIGKALLIVVLRVFTHDFSVLRGVVSYYAPMRGFSASGFELVISRKSKTARGGLAAAFRRMRVFLMIEIGLV